MKKILILLLVLSLSCNDSKNKSTEASMEVESTKDVDGDGIIDIDDFSPDLLIYEGKSYDQTSTKKWFGSENVIGNYSMKDATVLKSIINDNDLDEAIFSTAFDEDLKLEDVDRLKNVWKFTSHSFGFIPPTAAGNSNIDILNAHSIVPDLSLKGAKIKVTLDRLYVKDYPGKGEHSILMDFYAKNQVGNQTEHVHFNQVYRIQEGQQAGISGYPVFVGLNVGNEGVEFKCYTVNVENKNDKKLVQFLEGDLFKSGLQLLNTVNPVTPILSDFSKGFTEGIANRNKNIPVQDIFLGLDFSEQITTRAKISEGSYVVIQVQDASNWNWSEWTFNRQKSQVVNKIDQTKSPEFNYFIFSISKME
jgi:hypothetical protein